MKPQIIALSLLGAVFTASAAQAQSRTGERIGEAVETAYEKVSRGASKVVNTGEYAIDRLADGSVRIVRQIGRGGEQAASVAGDAWITSKVKAQLAADRIADAFDIDVDTKNGVVTLNGRADSSAAAARAVRIAATTDGVKEVRSHLQSPTPAR